MHDNVTAVVSCDDIMEDGYMSFLVFGRSNNNKNRLIIIIIIITTTIIIVI